MIGVNNTKLVIHRSVKNLANFFFNDMAEINFIKIYLLKL